MPDGLSAKQILEVWVEAAMEFSTARIANFGKFSWTVWWARARYSDRRIHPNPMSDMELYHHLGLAQELLGARPKNGRDAFDEGLLRSRISNEVESSIEMLLGWCRVEGVLDAEEAERLGDNIRSAIARRQAQLRRRKNKSREPLP